MEKPNTGIREKPLILVLGGTYGVGKTTLAHQLSKELNIPHRAGLGFCYYTLKTLLPDNPIVKNWGLYNTSNKTSLKKILFRETKLISKVIHTLIDSATKTGENYIIEGLQLLPKYLPFEKTRYCVLTVTNADEYKRRFEHPTETRTKHLNNSTLEIAKTIEEIILEEAAPYNVPVFDNTSPISETSQKIREHFRI